MVILLSFEDSAGPIKLLNEDEPHHLMREGHARKGDHGLRAFVHGFGEPVRPANDKDEVATGSLSLPEPFGKLDAASLLSTFVEEDKTVLGLNIF